MVERDYIKRLIKQLFDALNELFLNRKGESVEAIQIQLSGFYEKYLGRESSFFYGSSFESILGLLVENRDTQKDGLIRVEMLAELLYRDAHLNRDAKLKQNLSEKALHLFEYLNANSNTFSVDREAKIDELRALSHYRE